MNLTIFGSIDSFLVAFAMVLAGCPAIYRSRVVLGFLAFDTLAGLTGSSLGVAVSPTAFAFAVALAVPVFRFARRWPALYLTLPLLFSIDNFVLGSSDATATLRAHLAGGIVSGALAFCGLTVGTSTVRLAARLRARTRLQLTPPLGTVLMYRKGATE